MAQATLTSYMHRAGIRSRRELAGLTGIAHSTLDDIFQHPQTARGFQIKSIAEACGLSDAEIGQIVREA